MTLTELLITITLERNQFILQIYLVYNTCAHQTILFGYRYRCLQNKFRVHVYTKPVCSTGVHKTSLQYMCTQNQFAVQVCSKPVYSTCVHKTGLKYRCTQNQFTVQVNLKPVYSTCIHKTRLEYTFIILSKGLSQVEKLAAQKYSFYYIYKYLTWAASENFRSACLQ